MQVQQSTEERSELGLSYELIGGMVLFFDFLILFFFPAGSRIGYKSGFLEILAVVAVLAFGLVLYGHLIRLRANK